MYYAYACITYSESEARESNPKIILGDKDIVSICMCVCVCIMPMHAPTRETLAPKIVPADNEM